MLSGKTIFISALDWGLGHATRCVSVIRNLQANNTIIIGVTPLTQPIFDEEFPELQKISVPAYDIKYSSFFPVWFKLLLDAPRIHSIIKREKKLIESIISDYKINLIISDNRFGLYSKKIHSIFITHQLFIKTPFANSFLQHINKKYILNFNEVWVPDFEDTEKNLSGQLSHGIQFHNNIKYIGPQSRLNKGTSTTTRFDFLILLSGPEPQQTILRNALVKKAALYPDLKFALVCPEKIQHGSKNIIPFISPATLILSELISGSKKIICRSGYSTLMDLHALNKKEIVLIPTPGQTEQEYLANYWREKFGAEVLLQKEIHSVEFEK